MAFTPISAKNCSVRVSAWVMYVGEWEVHPSTNPIDIANAEGGGFEDWIASLIGASIEIENLLWDSQSGGSIYSSTPNLVVGGVVAISLFTAGTSSPGWVFGSALVTDAPMAAKVRDAIRIPKLSLKGKGSFTYPTN